MLQYSVISELPLGTVCSQCHKDCIVKFKEIGYRFGYHWEYGSIWYKKLKFEYSEVELHYNCRTEMEGVRWGTFKYAEDIHPVILHRWEEEDRLIEKYGKGNAETLQGL